MNKNTERFAAFIIERHRIYERRKRGKSPPWTMDKILQTYRFCNVYRELDRVTQWIAKNWRTPHKDYPDLWFSLVIARLINHPPTLASFALPGRWNRDQFIRVLHRRREQGMKTFGSAYIVSTNGQSIDKAEYLADYVLSPMWKDREKLRPTEEDTLREYFSTLYQYQGMGSFITAQVIADLKYVQPLRGARDWWTFAASGPGSRRGLNRVLGYEVKERWNEYEWYLSLRTLANDIAPLIAKAGMDRLHLQDLQNCLCEFDKYERARLGQGRPKQKFEPFTDQEELKL